ncbi:DUF72 domain-containing protein [Variovorax sp. J22R133]|uniref:DUF72 domain-containing protein n=1 Tax=Variovorax brevis TaxID=3053503 RepID=UPI002577EBAB|nr:DUF72 domain-containing protein [Variovorax sp. J22R133]MDM0113403.1 DUF72 domain-containing protein [Variovorax sp. J22R133]
MRTIIPAAERMFIGCAGWSLPRAQWPKFASQGSHLERYAGRFNVVEINSSFYRPHRVETYARWAESTPDDFRFAVKLPQTITHELRLVNAMAPFDAFAGQVAGLGSKLGCLVVQLPPSLAFDAAVVKRFLSALRRRHEGPVALEPRHESWFASAPDALLASFRIARVLADPVLFLAAAAPGGFDRLVYLRLHGSPRRYWSRYADDLLLQLAQRLRMAQAGGAQCWCIFDNTAGGEAIGNALTLADALGATQAFNPPNQ